MPTNSGSVTSVHSLPLSVKNQTKEKFDALLKTALQKKISHKSKKSVSKEKLLNDLESTTASSENLYKKAENIELNEYKESSSENYILNKFLDQQTKYDTTELSSVEAQNDKNAVIKPPVPKPRKKKCISPVSQGTFEVTSPKVVKSVHTQNKDNDGSPNSATSKGTFRITSPQVLKNADDDKNEESSSSKKTYNLEEVGDVLIHKSPLVPKIIKRTKNSKQAKESDSEIASDNEAKILKSGAENRIVETDDEIEKLVKSKKPRGDTTESEDGITKHKKRSKVLDEDVNPKNRYSYEKIIEIIIHKTDRLQLSSLVVHPMVKIHVIDATSGKYLPKSDKSRSVVFFYENNENDYISPVMTHACNLQEKRILYPSWQESILLNEDYAYFQDEGSHIILFFEIMDFVSFAASQQLTDKECTSGWHSIAFAFLKVSGKNNSLNIGRKLRLQLYHSCQSKKYNPQICNPWIWWKKRKLRKYPSTVHVTIKSTISPGMVIETFRSKTPVQKETSSRTKLCDDHMLNTDVRDSRLTGFNLSKSDSKISATNWSKKPNETCKLPNKCLVQFKSYDQGCFIMKFSHNGVHLACAVQIENLFYVILYSVILLREVNKFCSHQALIYDIKWSKNDSLLLSASADNTVSVYNLTSNLFFQILPHPSFVYCCDITQDKLIASGCYDGMIRIWNQVEQDTKFEFQLFQELEAHVGYVTSLCFSKKSSLFSADSTGIIIEWQKQEVDWVLKRQINLLDLKESIINQILLFPKERKLLVHSRDNIIRIIDVKSGCVLQWLCGGLNKRFQIFPAISPCGTFVFSGSESGVVHVWDSKSGREIASYVPSYLDNQFLTIHCVDFHPHDNILAISHYGKNVPVLLYHFDPAIREPTVNIVVKEEYYLENQLQQSKSESKVTEISRRIQSAKKSDEKLDFKGVLQKMDMVISSQIS